MNRDSLMNNKRGFTILELLIVIFIIIILMSIVLASFDRSRNQINSDKLISDMRLVRLSLEEYRAECKVYPDELENDANNAYATSGSNQDCGLEFGDLVAPQVDLDDFEYVSLTTNSNIGNCTSYLLAVQIDPEHGILQIENEDHDKKPVQGWSACGGSVSTELPTDDAEGWFNHAQLPNSELVDL